MAVPAAGEFIRILDSIYKFHCRRMDRLVQKTRKKLQKTISKTRNISVRNYAFDRLREVCSPEIYINTLNDMETKERKSDVKEILIMRKVQAEKELMQNKLTGGEK